MNPLMLLNPKGKGSQKLPQQYDGAKDSREGEGATTTSSVGAASMIEKMHRVEHREGRPAKRPKHSNEANGQKDDTNNDDEQLAEVNHSKSKSQINGGTGLVTGALKTDDETQTSKPPEVDLTADSDEEEEEVDDSTNRKNDGTTEVCLGRIEGAKVNAHRVPTPKNTAMYQNQQHHWMAMAVGLYRRTATNHIVGVKDPVGKDFGNIDPRTAAAIAPLMDGGQQTGVRFQARLDARPKKPFDYPGQAISDRFDVSLNVYAQRKYVSGLGRWLSQKQVWLRDPMAVDRNVQVINPHSTKDFGGPPRSKLVSQGSGYVATRTVEQVRQDVSKIFDTLKSTEDLPEMNPPQAIITTLLPHQKQAIHFLFKREKLPVSIIEQNRTIVVIDDDNDDDANDDRNKDKDKAEDVVIVKDNSGKSKAPQDGTIWQKKIRPDGQVRWLNAITGHETRREPQPLLGGILADVMGLGKTLNILSLVLGSLGEAEHWASQTIENEKDPPFTKGTLLVCPLSTIVNWKEQIAIHLKDKSLSHYVYQGAGRTNDPDVLREYDLVITTYQSVGNEWARNSRNRPNKPLFENNWFRVVLDEAHQIRNSQSTQSQAACALRGQRRWCVTGTPVQNRLDDLATLIKFLRIEPFHDPRNFAKFISGPLRTGNKDAIPKLRILVDFITLRRLKDKLDLPERTEQIITLSMSESERHLYEQFQRDTSRKVDAMAGNKKKLGGKSYAQVLKAVGRLRMLCAHGGDMLSDEDWEYARGFDPMNAIDLEDDDEGQPDKTSRQAYEMYRLMRDANVCTCPNCNNTVEPSLSIEDLEDDEDETFGYLTPCNQVFCPKCIKSWTSDMKKVVGPDNRGVCAICDTYIRLTSFELKQRALIDDTETQAMVQKSKFARNLARYNGPHTKTKTLLSELAKSRHWSETHPEERPIKSVVFSEWTTHLDLIQLAFVNNKVQFTRLDGSMTFSNRTKALAEFDNSTDVNIILVSLKAGGLGLNLTAASKVYVMEPNYNPAAEQQAIERVHRLGQKRNVLITRYVMKNSVEEKVVELQDKKKKLAQFSVERDTESLSIRAERTLEDIKSLLR